MLRDMCCDDPASPADGLRLMVTAKYPRGRSRELCDAYLPELAPDWEDVQAFQSGALDWTKFGSRYRRKLKSTASRHLLELLAATSERQAVTVMCACPDRARCHRSILVEEIPKAKRTPEGA